MSVRNLMSGLSLGLARVPRLLAAFGHWWLQELLALFPPRVAQWLADDGSRVLVLARSEGGVALYLRNARRQVLASAEVSDAEYTPAMVEGFLRSQRLRLAHVSLGVGLPAEAIFCRSLMLPRETRRALDAIVLQDLLSKTPFEVQDIYHAYDAQQTADKIAVAQWVVRRKRVHDAIDDLGLDRASVCFVEPQSFGQDGAPPPTIAWQTPPGGAGRLVRRAYVGLIAVGVGLAILIGTTRYQRQQELLESLGAEVTALTARAREVRATLARVEQDQASLLRLRAKKGEPGLLDIWEQATRLLPDHSWLTELRVSETPEGRQVVLSGYSTTAASLVGLIAQSELFSEPALIAPIAVDPTEDRERFTIQAATGRQAKPRTASR